MESSSPARATAFEAAWRESSGRPLLIRFARAVSGAGETALSFAVRPEASFRGFPVEGSMLAALIFGTLLGGPCLLLAVALRSVLVDEPLPGLAMALALLLAAPALYLYLRAQALHLTLVLSGKARRSFAATLRVVGYANGSLAPLLLLPIAGDLLFLVAGSMAEVSGIRKAHGLRLGEAIAVELVPVSLLLLALGAALIVAFLGWSQVRS